MLAWILDMSIALIAPVLTFFLAKYLGPEDYGTYGYVLIQISLFKILSDSLIVKVFQKFEIDNKFTGRLVWLIVLISIPACFLSDLKSRGLLYVFILLSILNSLIYSALINSEKRERATVTKFIKVTFPVLALYVLRGQITDELILYAFIFSLLFNVLFNLKLVNRIFNLMSFKVLRFDHQDMKSQEEYRFIRFYLMDLIVVWLIGFGDQFVLGINKNVIELGGYRMAMSLMILPFAIVFSPVVSFLFRELVVRADKLIRHIKFYLESTMLLSLLIGLGSYILVCAMLKFNFLNSDWDNLQEYSMLIAIYLFNGWAVYPIKEYLYASRKERLAFIFSISEGAIYGLLLISIFFIPFTKYLLLKVLLSVVTSSIQYLLLVRVNVIPLLGWFRVLVRYILCLVALISSIYFGMIWSIAGFCFALFLSVILLYNNYDKYNYSNV